MLPTILTILAILVILFLAFVATRPSDFRIVRSITMASPPAEAFGRVNDLHRWESWSPWAKLDPQMKVTYEGPPQGVGASHAWLGNKKVGQGRMTILESEADRRIVLKLEFIKPFTATNTTEFTFEPKGSQTLVTWAMTGRNNFVMKAFGLFMNMDKMIGRDFEKGLAAIKAEVEAR